MSNSLNDKGDKITTTGRFKSDFSIERGNQIPGQGMIKSYVDTSLQNFGDTKISFQEEGMKHKEFASGGGLGVTIPIDKNLLG